MRWLVDNNVPRSVTVLLRDSGFDAIEVRSVLGQEAPDDAIAAYAVAEGLLVVTHDRGLARRASKGGVPHLWLRTREDQDRDRLRESLPVVLSLFDLGAVRVLLFANVIRMVASGS